MVNLTLQIFKLSYKDVWELFYFVYKLIELINVQLFKSEK